jgi:hypothetical protein
MLLVLAGAGFSAAADKPLITPEEDLTQEVVLRCIFHLGEFGTGMVHSCTEADLAAARALRDYSAARHADIAACAEKYITHGWSRVKQCADAMQR